MWVALPTGWLSIVAHRDRGDHLLVRARASEHILSIFPDVDVFELLDADYPWRAEILRTMVGDVLAQHAMEMEYGNFKSAVQDSRLSKAFLGIWEVMYSYGQRIREEAAW